MPMFDKSANLTEGPGALDLFTDRVDSLRVFCRHLHADPPDPRILFFHGVGGIGKSLLLHYLRDKACVLLHPDDWRFVAQVQDDDDFAHHMLQAQAGTPVPSTWIDFGARPQGENRPQELFSALLMLRRRLGSHGLSTPLFDFAVVWYLLQTEKSIPPDRLKQLLPPGAFDIAEFLIELVADPRWQPWMSLGTRVLDQFNTKLGERFTMYRHSRKLDENDIEDIKRMDPNPDSTPMRLCGVRSVGTCRTVSFSPEICGCTGCWATLL